MYHENILNLNLGLPKETPATLINKVCGKNLDLFA